MGRQSQGWRLRRPARKGGPYTVRFSHAGRQREFSTGKCDPEEAAREAARIYAEVVSGRRAEGRVASSPLDLLFAEWLADVEAHLHETTSAQYFMYVEKHFLPFFKRLDAITTGGLADYQRHRLRKVTRVTLKKERSALRGFLNWCVEQGHLEEPPRFPILPRKAQGNRRHERRTVDLTEADVEGIIAQLPERVSHAGKPKAFYTVMWETGLRTATLQRLRVPDDYKPGDTELRIPDAKDKARFGRVLPLSPRARAALDAASPEIGLIFGKHEHRQVLRSAARRAGLPEDKVEFLSNHDFRHARTTFLAERTDNLPGVAFLLGHKHLTTTDRYVRRRRKAAEDVLRAVGALEPEPASGSDSRGDSRGAAPEAPSPAASEEERGSLQLPETKRAIKSVRKRGVEPPRVLPHRNLNPARLPIPPLPRARER